MKRKFINVGFEFTAAIKQGVRLPKNLYRGGGSDRTHLYSRYKAKVSKHKWICDKFEADSCGCEVATPIIRNKKDVSRYFNEFNQFVNENNLTIDIDNSVCGLGGCHIHLGIGFMSLPFRKRFLKNVGIYLTNHPQLNWAFNDPNDNCNANSLLTQSRVKDEGSIFCTTNIETSCYATNDGFRMSISSNGFVQPKAQSNLLDPFKDDVSPLAAFLSDPTKIFLKKKYALRYNEDFKTLELRIFDMPKNLKQHLLHYDVAMAIFNLCYKATLEKRELSLLYHDWVGYIGEPLEVALLKFDLCIERLKIDKRRVADMRENIITRHKWTDLKHGKKEYKAKEIYLY